MSTWFLVNDGSYDSIGVNYGDVCCLPGIDPAQITNDFFVKVLEKGGCRIFGYSGQSLYAIKQKCKCPEMHVWRNIPDGINAIPDHWMTWPEYKLSDLYPMNFGIKKVAYEPSFHSRTLPLP